MNLRPVFLMASLAVGNVLYGQPKLVLKPGLTIGFALNSIRERLTVDESFVAPKPGFSLTLLGRVEYHLTSKSYLDGSIRGSEAPIKFAFGKPGVFRYIHQTSVEYTQFNFVYNRFLSRQKGVFQKLLQDRFFLRPKFAVGFGLNRDRSKEYYDREFKNQYLGERTSTVSYWRLYTATPDLQFGLHVLGRLGCSFFNRDRELFDLVLEWNQGLTNLTNVDLQYNINGTTYRTLLGSRGTNATISLGLPITILRRS